MAKSLKQKIKDGDIVVALRPSITITKAEMDAALSKGTYDLVYIDGQHTPFMARVVKKHGMRMGMWDVSAQDGKTTNAQALAAHVLAKVKGGSIIDLHDGVDAKAYANRAVVVAALPLILDGLRRRGLQPVSIDELMGGNAYQACAKSKS